LKGEKITVAASPAAAKKVEQVADGASTSEAGSVASKDIFRKQA
jgi:hypothetical protein